ncbi:MAG: S1C family serine protease [Oscillospiraceae bacterium]
MYPYDQENQKKVRLGTGTIVLVIVLALVAGLGGAAIYQQFLYRPDVTEVSVVLQTAPESAVSGEIASHTSVVEEVADLASSSIVEVTTESKATHPFYGSYITSGAGSGVILSADGYIVTNYHVIDGATSVEVRLHSGEELAAQVVGGDKQTDLAVLKVSAEGLSPAIIADSNEVRVGQPVVAIGNPLGTLGGTVTEGIISAKDREITIDGEAMVLLQTSAAINPGNSGGGLFNADGHLIGVVNAKSSGSDIEGLGFAIPSNTAKSVVTQLIENGYVTGRPSLGITVVEVNSAEDLYRYRVSDYGVYVYNAVYDNGLRQWDRILEVDGARISSSADIKEILRNNEVGDSLEITIHRGLRDRTIQVELRESVPSETGSTI